MPIKRLTSNAWERSVSRILYVGPPASEKTTGALTVGKNFKPTNAHPEPFRTGVVVYPGESGFAVIPADDPNIVVFHFEMDDVMAKVNPGAIVKEIEQVTFDIIAGKYGPIDYFLGDGLHKLYYCVLNAITGGALAAGEDFPGINYGRARQQMTYYLDRVRRSTVSYAGWTIWDKYGKDEPDDKNSVKMRQWVGLPGQYSTDIVGEFGTVLYCVPGQPAKQGERQRYMWLTQPTNRIGAAGIKCPPSISAKIPPIVPQDWDSLEALIVGKPTQKGGSA